MDLTRKSFARRFFGRLFIGALVVGPLLYTIGAARYALLVRAAMRASKADEAGLTAARVVRGKVVESPRTATPALPGHVAWMAHVGQWRGSAKSRTFVVLCIVSRVDGLRIEDAKTHETVTVDGFESRSGDFPSGLPIFDPGRVAVDLWRNDAPTQIYTLTAANVPEPVRTLCKDWLVADSLDYQERFVELGNDVTVRGCARAKNATDDVIEPCGDGLDTLTASSLASMRQATRDEQTPKFAFGAVFAFIGLGILGILASRRLARSKRPERSGVKS